MNLVDSKMHFLRNYNHDFPRLAKQSGFIFQSYEGRVNWSEIECLNLDDIIENRNFELLEKNLLNVINCNLERDYDLKILDQNFVKLFKLAQLGIDYLSYCQLYLDRCVVLLQEQLMSIQEEYESLKNDNEGKDLELKKTKSKKKVNNYQCDKCEKVFISDVYLKFHDKRRHRNLSTPKSEEGLSKKLVDVSQQTESERKLSVSIQTVFDGTETTTQKNEEIRKIKKNHNKKIKRLEKNLNDLKTRLQKTEKSLQEAREVNSNLAPVSFPSSAHYHPLLQFMPPCFPGSQNIDEAIAEYQKAFLKYQPAVSNLVVDVDPKVSESHKSPVSGNALKKYNDSDNKKNTEVTEIDLINDKENMNPQASDTVIKPLPPPRKTKKKITEENLTIKTYNQRTDSAHSVTTIVPFSNQSVDSASVKGKSDMVIHPENLEDTNAEETNLNETLNISKEKNEEELESFFKKVVGKKPPNLQKFTKNLKRPLTNFYDSVSSSGKNFMKIEKKFQSTKNAVVDDLNNHLRELGIDPEWKGIPKKTVKQKLKNLTSRRKLLSKENPLYMSVRQSAEEKIFEKLKKNFFTKKPSPQKLCGQEAEEEIIAVEGNPCTAQGLENIEDRNCAILYETDEESWPKMSEWEKNQQKQSSLLYATCKQQPKADESDSEEEDASRPGEKKFDIHVFQVKTGGSGNREEKCKKDTRLNEVDELLTNSDFEDDFLIPSDDEFFKRFHVNANG